MTCFVVKTPEVLLSVAVLLGLSSGACALEPPANTEIDWVTVPGGTFTMGTDHSEARPDERPAHQVRVGDFQIARTEVTNAQFEAFVNATGYLTTAERPIDWEILKKQVPEDTPKPDDDVLVPGALVFTPPSSPVETNTPARWWRWTPGASWRHPTGPGSSTTDLEDHPVVHVSWEDAQAFCAWAGGRLPTEAEWERAARIGQDDQRFIWGDEFRPNDRIMANTWDGRFPQLNTAEDGHVGTAPVGSFPSNEIGLHDMAGNVWEWTADRFDVETYARRTEGAEAHFVVIDPVGPNRSADPRNPLVTDSRVQKGGSFLCNPSYCSSYRPSARMASTPDSGLSHLGFRPVRVSPEPRNDADSDSSESKTE